MKKTAGFTKRITMSPYLVSCRLLSQVNILLWRLCLDMGGALRHGFIVASAAEPPIIRRPGTIGELAVSE
jgi:hypothetical protein